MIKSNRIGRVYICSGCLRDYFDHPHSNQLCESCLNDMLTFKDLEDTYEYPLEDSEQS
tara:strand:+ start:223 stop:396 length:174 start_codon:yes stop_codon:yes gene_type:complete